MKATEKGNKRTLPMGRSGALYISESKHIAKVHRLQLMSLILLAVGLSLAAVAYFPAIWKNEVESIQSFNTTQQGHVSVSLSIITTSLDQFDQFKNDINTLKRKQFEIRRIADQVFATNRNRINNWYEMQVSSAVEQHANMTSEFEKSGVASAEVTAKLKSAHATRIEQLILIRNELVSQVSSRVDAKVNSILVALQKGKLSK